VSGTAENWVRLGRVLGPWGVKCWIKVYSYTDPRENIVNFPVWSLEQDGRRRSVKIEHGRRHGSQVVVKLHAVDDCDAAELLAGAEILVERGELAPCDDGEYYWTDLEGLRVVTLAGVDLGQIDHLFATGSNDVMVVIGDKERLIPFLAEQVVQTVDLGEGIVVVDWDPDF
jgi:16S rRNA processing protein RimM